ncbi:Papain-like cysteine peptidase superfamily [Arabidopsis suecica]|uniref:Papain-like cysteine peptidase superfamily n=1 Tax=Arabidopsis suecica TaxID=45249 RepID=A0A8T2AGI9_ARASU|nr:Papain-like cysteine peptidase superfamily [Arabidopsis suecica]
MDSCGLDECNDLQLAHHVSLPSDPASDKEILGTDLISEVPNQLVTAHATGGLCSGHPERVVPINYVLIDSSPVPLDELPPQLAQKYLKPMKGRTKRGMIASTRCNVNKYPKRQKQGLPGHVDYIPFHPVPQRLSATFKKQLLAYRKSTYDIDGCEVGITLFSDIYTPQKWIFSTYSNFVNAAAPSAFLWDPLVASYIEGTDILDPYLECFSDNEVATYMEPLVTMLPHLLKASCDPTDISVLLDSPFSYHRVEGLPQNTRTGDCGPFVMKLIEMHSHNFSVEDMGHIPDAKVDIFRMDYVIRVYEEFIGFIISLYSNCSHFCTFHITFFKMDNLVDDAAIEIYRRVAETSFTMLAPLLLVGKKQSKLAFSEAVLSSLSLHEFFNNPKLANEGSAFRSFFLKCVATNNPVANYLESLRIVGQHGDVSHAIAMLYSAVPESDYITFSRGMFLIVAQFPSEGIATISSLLNRLGTVAQVDAIGTVVFRHLSIFRPRRRRLFSNLLVLDSIPVCVGNACNLQNRCLNCLMYWFIIRLNYVL